MKTTTILNAWSTAVFDFQHGHGDAKTQRQCQTFGRALRRRIEQGDRARAIIAEIAEANRYERDNDDFAITVTRIINSHSDWLDDLPT